MENMKQNPFQDIRIVDFTHVYSGPYCTMLFADLGAQVFKVERPELGDDTRQFTPFKNDESGYFMYLNRNKKSIVLDLKSPEGIKIAMDLIVHSDVVIENFAPGTMVKLGLDYETVKKQKPDIIYASISGFGQNGPLSKKPAYDVIAQAMSGMMSITGFPDRPPVKAGSSISDANAGIHTAFALMAALYYKEKTGKGQFIDVAMMDTTVSIMENNLMEYIINGKNPPRIGNEHPVSAPFDAYETKDGYVVVATANNKMFGGLLKVMHREDLAEDPRYATNISRRKYFASLNPPIIAWMKEHTNEEIITLLDAEKVPVAPVLSVEEVVNHPQMKARDMLIEVEHPVAGKMMIPGFPIHFSESKGTVRTAAPLLGADSEEVLADFLHYDEEKIKELKDKHII